MIPKGLRTLDSPMVEEGYTVWREFVHNHTLMKPLSEARDKVHPV